MNPMLGEAPAFLRTLAEALDESAGVGRVFEGWWLLSDELPHIEKVDQCKDAQRRFDDKHHRRCQESQGLPKSAVG